MAKKNNKKKNKKREPLVAKVTVDQDKKGKIKTLCITIWE
jgi:hypothetical protein